MYWRIKKMWDFWKFSTWNQKSPLKKSKNLWKVAKNTTKSVLKLVKGPSEKFCKKSRAKIQIWRQFSWEIAEQIHSVHRWLRLGWVFDFNITVKFNASFCWVIRMRKKTRKVQLLCYFFFFNCSRHYIITILTLKWVVSKLWSFVLS